ncbi:MAG: exo-alpha-sialidase [Lachnospiraceae bacterium]|nr:exo-alpha-sialidase [Lachnospiraceae bacterium]
MRDRSYLLEDGKDREFSYYRRPGIVRGPQGLLIAYYEGQHFEYPRYQKLFGRISRDGGETWGERVTLVAGGETGMLHNCMMVFADGVLHCLWNVQYRQLWHRTSQDGGETWSEPEDLTRMLWRAETDYPWNAFGIGSGHGIVLRSGRILLPTWFTTGGDGHKPSGFANIYTDDGFRTLGIGAVLKTDGAHDNIINPNEGAIVELPDGTVMATVRHDCPQRQRAVSFSKNGTENWSRPEYRPDLPDPICHASLERLDEEGILFCNCANADEGIEEKVKKGLCRYNWSDDARKNLTLRVSRDGGRHFSSGVCLTYKGGYSDIAAGEKQIVCIYETGWDEKTDTCIFPRQLGITLVELKALEEHG